MRFLRAVYRPLLVTAVRHRVVTVSLAALLFAGAVLVSTRIGSEFMPPLNEGDLMYMPVTDPAISIDEAARVLGLQDGILKSFPEVEWAVGKAGRAETSTDPSPVNMNETIVHLKPEAEWRDGMTRERLVAEMDAQLRMPGVTNIWTQPIINRIEMLATGMRSQVGVKVFGNDLKTLGDLLRMPTSSARCRARRRLPREIASRPTSTSRQPQAAARYGLTRDDSDPFERAARPTSRNHRGGRRFPSASGTRRIPRLAPGHLRIPSPLARGVPVPLSTRTSTVAGPSMIQRENACARPGAFSARPRHRRLRREARNNRPSRAVPPGYFRGRAYENQERRQLLLFVAPSSASIIFATSTAYLSRAKRRRPAGRAVRS